MNRVHFHRLGLTALALVSLFACDGPIADDVLLGSADAGGGRLAPSESSPEVPEAGGSAMCPTANCSGSRTTCETSTHLCDVDLANDPRNCGACGQKCQGAAFSSDSTGVGCLEGKCVMKCKAGFGDCDGLPETQCETTLGTPEHCATCGDACADGVPCVARKCGCPAPYVNCEPMRCNDVRVDPNHCGACGHACVKPEGLVVPDHMTYGCGNSECGLRCDPDWMDANNSLADGCETPVDPPGPKPCLPPLVECNGRCVDLDSDDLNCGGCNQMCPGAPCDYDQCPRSIPNARGFCSAGVCRWACFGGFADCNGSDMDVKPIHHPIPFTAVDVASNVTA